ncbi:MAG: 16S rRNA (guanine(966)-N(2))-methyltransferase RsmD [Paracoccaceae bacterium]|nr:16S rRNA (guanine(966)-N(2))-methyltransferase RsmD [Paracoccaceae bacterium]
MRIVGGRLGGLKLADLGRGDSAAQLRPTADRVRENLFNILANRGLPEDATVLDLFAGTGALGLEALSRGAAHVTFVDTGAKAQALIRANIAKARAEADTRLLHRDATRLGPAERAATLVFLDPPYGRGLGERALAAAAAGGWLAPGATLVWEEAGPITAPRGFALQDTRRYGAAHIHILEAP